MKTAEDLASFHLRQVKRIANRKKASPTLEERVVALEEKVRKLENRLKNHRHVHRNLMLD